MVLHLLGQIHAVVKQRSFEPEDVTECIINKARMLFRTHIDDNISMENVAQELNVSYA